MKFNYDLKKIGKLIQIERKSKNHSQLDLANMNSVNQSTISRIEKGDKSISLDLYEGILNSYSLKLESESNIIFNLLEDIYFFMNYNYEDKLLNAYSEVLTFDKLSYKEYSIKKLIEGLYYIALNHINKLYILNDYLIQCEFMYDSKTLKYYYLVLGYNSYFKRKYVKACEYFQNGLKFINNNEDSLFIYIYSYNNIILRRYEIASIYLSKSLEYNEKINNEFRVYHIKRLLGFIHFHNSNYNSALKLFLGCFENNDYLNTTKFIRAQVNLYTAVSYMFMNNYKEAIKHLNDIIENRLTNKYIELIYTYIFICFKKTDDDRLLNQYKKKFNDEKIDNNKREMAKYLLMIYDDNYSFNYDNFNYIYENEYANELFIHTIIIYKLIALKLWKKRKYGMYKTLNDIIIKQKYRGINYEI